MKRDAKRIFLYILTVIGILYALFWSTYLVVLPKFVSSKAFSNFIQNQIANSIESEVIIKNPKLKTAFSPVLGFTIEYLSVKKDEKEILNLDDFDLEISFRDLYKRHIIINKILAQNIYANAGEIEKLTPKTEKKEKTESFFFFDVYKALMGVKNCRLEYKNSDIYVDFRAKHLIVDNMAKNKALHFDFSFELKKGNHRIYVAANDKNKIYFADKKFHIDDFPIIIENSKIIIRAIADKKHNYELTVYSDDFSARDVYDIVASNIVIPNGSEILKPVCDVSGRVDYKIKITNKNIDGKIAVKDVNFGVVDLLKMPVKVTKGTILIGTKNIELKDFEGFYNNKKENKYRLKGTIKDYLKTFDTEIKSDIFVTNDFFQNYLSKMLNSPIYLVGNAGSKLKIKAKAGKVDILWYFFLREGDGFKLGDQSMVLQKHKTLFKLDLSIINNILKINTINYYITNEMKRGIKPVLTLDGSVDMADNMKYQTLNLKMPQPLPSEFINFLIGQKLFKKGEISGAVSVDNTGKCPVLKGEMALNKVLVPSQRLYVRSANLDAQGNKIIIKSEGRFKRSSYNLDGKILNELVFPIIVKDLNLTVDNIDVEKMLEVNTSNANTTAVEDENNNDVPTFQKGLVVVEKCVLNLVKGVYKDIKFGNLIADLTLDKDGVLKLKSNRFDIAEGVSTLRINADLDKNKYYLKLGIRDVNSDTIASSMLSLPREISGKARGLIELNSDKSLKLNGNIKFDIKDGAIEKVGYVEYILKVASLFRNPLAMISPSTIGDLVTVPDGEFDLIHGELTLKNNIIERMKIQSTADELASLIFGRYNLDTNDASLRIYTKFSDKGSGFGGFLRNFSLNTLATKLSISSRNESNYYASELEMIPKLSTGEDTAQVFLTKIDGDVVNYNFLSTLKRIK